MAIQFLYQVPEFCLSGNPIAYHALVTNQQLTASLYLETAQGANDFELIHTEVRTKDQNSRVLIDFASVLDAELQVQWYDLDGTSMVEGRWLCRRFFVAFREGKFEQVSQADSETVINLRYVLKGAQHFMQYDPNALPFPSYRSLSLQAETRSMLPGQKEWHWIMPSSAGISIDLTYTVTQGNGQLKQGTSVHYGTTEKYLPIGIPLHVVFDQEYALDPSLSAIRFSVLGQTVSLKAAYEGLPYLREFYFANALGGLDSLVTYGKGQRTTTFKSEQSRNYVDYATARSAGAYSRHQVEARESYQVNMGYRSKEEREAARALLYSQLAFERVAEQYWPIIITSSQIQDEKDGVYRYSLNFSYQYAFDSQALWH